MALHSLALFLASEDICVKFPNFCEIIDKTSGNISPLYRLDTFD